MKLELSRNSMCYFYRAFSESEGPITRVTKTANRRETISSLLQCYAISSRCKPKNPTFVPPRENKKKKKGKKGERK